MKKINRISYKIEQIKKLNLYEDYINWLNHDYFPNEDEKSKMCLWNLNYIEYPMCKTCKKQLKFNTVKKPFNTYCSKSCSNNDPEIKNKIKTKKEQTCLEKYGYTSASKCQSVKNKFKETISKKTDTEKKESQNKRENTLLKNYGVTNPAHSKEILEKRINSFKKSNYKETYKKTCLEKYGVEHPWSDPTVRDKCKQTNIDIYGVDNPLKSDEIKNKIKQTCLEKYKEDSYFKTDEFKEKYKNTCLEKYGVDNTFKSDEVKNKIYNTNLERYNVKHYVQADEYKEKYKNTCLEKYGVDNISKIPFYIDKIKQTRVSNTIKSLQKQYPYVVDYIPVNKIVKCVCENTKKIYEIPLFIFKERIKYKKDINIFNNPLPEIIVKNSKPCNELYEFIKSVYKGEIKINDRSMLDGLEIDIFIPEFKLAIEFNGLYWHSEIYKDKNYHINKKEIANIKGINLIHIWEDDWNYKKDIIKSIIKNKLNLSKVIYARNTQIKKLTISEYKNFIDLNHLQGKENQAIYYYGLIHNDEIVSVIGFSKLRKNLGQKHIEDNYELTRMCNKLNTTCIGGFSKLFKHFIKDINPKRIISYCNLDIFDGKTYENNGMNLIRKTEPNYFWIVDNKRRNRYTYTKHNLIKMGYDKNKSESEIMHESGYFKIYNSGNFLFEKKF